MQQHVTTNRPPTSKANKGCPGPGENKQEIIPSCSRNTNKNPRAPIRSEQGLQETYQGRTGESNGDTGKGTRSPKGTQEVTGRPEPLLRGATEHGDQQTSHKQGRLMVARSKGAQGGQQQHTGPQGKGETGDRRGPVTIQFLGKQNLKTRGERQEGHRQHTTSQDMGRTRAGTQSQQGQDA